MHTLFLRAILGQCGGALYESKGSIRFSCGPYLAEVVVHYMRAGGAYAFLAGHSWPKWWCIIWEQGELTLFLRAILGRSGGALYESKGSSRFSCGPYLAEVVVHYMRARGAYAFLAGHTWPKWWCIIWEQGEHTLLLWAILGWCGFALYKSKGISVLVLQVIADWSEGWLWCMMPEYWLADRLQLFVDLNSGKCYCTRFIPNRTPSTSTPWLGGNIDLYQWLRLGGV